MMEELIKKITDLLAKHPELLEKLAKIGNKEEGANLLKEFLPDVSHEDLAEGLSKVHTSEAGSEILKNLSADKAQGFFAKMFHHK